MDRKTLFVHALAFLAWAIPCGTATAAGTVPGEKVTDVGVRQQRVQRDFQELEQKTLRVIEAIQEADPERATQLQRALDWARDKVLSGRLGSVADLLHASKLMDAKEMQSSLTSDLEAMLRLLQEELSEYDRLQKRIEQLDAWRERALELARDEWREMRDSEKALKPGEEQARLDKQIARVEQMIAAQKKLRQDTEKAQGAGQSSMAREAGEQGRLEKDTRGLLAGMSGASQSGQSGQPGQAGDEASDPARAPEAGEEALKAAADEQTQSEGNLNAQKTPASLANQAKAIDKLEQALHDMKQARERMQRQDLQKAKAAQDQTEQQTVALDQDMAQAEDPSGQSGQSGQPGQSSVRQAQKSMQNASSQLGKKDPGKAAPEQKEANRQLANAAEELKKEMQRLRDEQRDALRRLLKEWLEKMLVQQKAATLRTVSLEEAKQKRKWTEDQRLDLTGIRESEVRIGQTAGQAVDMVTQDGSAVVFGALLLDVQESISNVVNRLQAEDTGRQTQDTQREIEKTIEELLAALEDNPPPPSEPKESQESQEQRPPPPPPLIALIQELRLLRTQQVRVNERTVSVENDFKKNNRPEQKADLPHLSERQNKIHALSKELIRKLSGQSQDPWDAI